MQERCVNRSTSLLACLAVLAGLSGCLAPEDGPPGRTSRAVQLDLEGTLRTSIRHTGLQSEDVYLLDTTGDGQTPTIDSVFALVNISSGTETGAGSRVRVLGSAQETDFGTVIDVSSITVLEAAAPAIPDPDQLLTVLVVPVSFLDSDYTSPADCPYCLQPGAGLEELYERPGAGDTVQSYWTRNAEGRWSFDFEFAPVITIPRSKSYGRIVPTAPQIPLGWFFPSITAYVLGFEPLGAAEELIRMAVFDADARATLVSQGVDLTRYDTIIYHFARGEAHSFNQGATYPRPNSGLPQLIGMYQAHDSFPVMAHELGHRLGLGHSGNIDSFPGWSTPGAGPADSEADAMSTFLGVSPVFYQNHGYWNTGDWQAVPDLNPSQKAFLEIASDRVTFTPGTQWTFRRVGSVDATPSAQVARILELPVGPLPDEQLYVTLRTDDELLRQHNRVAIHLGRRNPEPLLTFGNMFHPTFLLPPQSPGQLVVYCIDTRTLNDECGNRVEIYVSTTQPNATPPFADLWIRHLP